MLLPFWLALSASVVLHLGVLLSPGWELPLDDAHEPDTLDATIVPPTPKTATKSAPATAKAVKRRPPARPLPPPVPEAPVASLPAESLPPGTESDPQPVDAPAGIAPPEVSAPVDDAVPPAPSFADRWARAGRIVYQVMRGRDGLIIGRSQQRWEHDGTRYTLRAEVETTGLAALFVQARVAQESRGMIEASGLRPLEFETRRDDRSGESVRFDPEAGQILFANGKSAAFVPEAQDLLSLFFQLGMTPSAGPQYFVTVATARKLARYTVTVGETGVLDIPLGQRVARRFNVMARADGDATEVWLDEETRLPLKIRHRDRKGEVFDQVATHIEMETTP